MLYDLCCGFHIHSWIYEALSRFRFRLLSSKIPELILVILKSGKFWLKIDSFLLKIIRYPMRNSFQSNGHFWTLNLSFSNKNVPFCQFSGKFSKKTWNLERQNSIYLWQIAIIQFRFQKFNLSLYRFFITYPTKTGNSLSPVCSFITCLTTIETNHNFTFQIMIMVSVLFMFYFNKFRF